MRQRICDAAIKIGRAVKYDNAGTVEFLVDADTNKLYFIEVNPRIQVEHTVTEIITGIDLIKSQILITQGADLSDPEINLPSQEAVTTQGFAFQCRITTEDPENKFTPDYGRITHYRSAGGLGIRLDGGPGITGGIVTPCRRAATSGASGSSSPVSSCTAHPVSRCTSAAFSASVSTCSADSGSSMPFERSVVGTL